LLIVRNLAACIANAMDSHLYSAYYINSQQQLPVAMIVCVCRRVSDREIARHAHAGMSFDEIQFELGVATQCGRCEGCARDVVAQCSASHPIAAIHNEAQSCAFWKAKHGPPLRPLSRLWQSDSRDGMHLVDPA